MNTYPTPRALPPVRLAQDIRRTLLLGLLGTGLIDVFASRRVARRTRSLPVGILACFWANLVYVLGTLLAFGGRLWGDSTDSYVTVIGPSVADLLTLMINTLVPALLVSVVCGWIRGWLGLRARAHIPPSLQEAALSPASTQVAAQNQLGQLLCFSPATSTANVMWSRHSLTHSEHAATLMLGSSGPLHGTAH